MVQGPMCSPGLLIHLGQTGLVLVEVHWCSLGHKPLVYDQNCANMPHKVREGLDIALNDPSLKI